MEQLAEAGAMVTYPPARRGRLDEGGVVPLNTGVLGSDSKGVIMGDSDPEAILREAKTIAVVGLSSNPERPSRRVAGYLKKYGYRVIPVNPNEEKVLGERAYDAVDQIPEQVDMVDVFLRPEKVPEVAKDAVRAGAKALWLQQGIKSQEARRIAQEGGLAYVEDECTHHVHLKLQEG